MSSKERNLTITSEENMFTKRHYEAIAELVGSQLLDNPTDSAPIIDDWCRMFEDDNPRFKRDTFEKAVNKSLDEAITSQRGYA